MYTATTACLRQQLVALMGEVLIPSINTFLKHVPYLHNNNFPSILDWCHINTVPRTLLIACRHTFATLGLKI